MLADVARARVRADVEAVRIAEAYSRDPLLKNLSVPRFRMPDIVVDIPVVIAGVDGTASPGDAWSVNKPTKVEMTRALKEGLARSDITLTKTQNSAAADAVLKKTDSLFETADRASMSPGSVAEELSIEVARTIKARTRRDVPESELKQIQIATKESIATLLAAKLSPSPAMQVMFAAEELKEHANLDNTVRLRVTITEDNYEVVERDDGQGYTLTPE